MLFCNAQKYLQRPFFCGVAGWFGKNSDPARYYVTIIVECLEWNLIVRYEKSKFFNNPFILLKTEFFDTKFRGDVIWKCSDAESVS